MGIAGNLKTMELAELLQWLSRGRKAGTRVARAEQTRRALSFRPSGNAPPAERRQAARAR